MPGPNIAAFFELSSRGVCSKGTSTHGKQHAAAWATDCCVATYYLTGVTLSGSTRFSQPHRFNVPFCSLACHRSCPARAVAPCIACNILAIDVAKLRNQWFCSVSSTVYLCSRDDLRLQTFPPHAGICFLRRHYGSSRSSNIGSRGARHASFCTGLFDGNAGVWLGGEQR